MCVECWIKFGHPQIVNQKTLDAAKLIELLYEHNPVGGALHVVVDDWNIEDGHVFRDPDWSGKESVGEMKVTNDLITLLRQMTLEERASALSLHRGYKAQTTKVFRTATHPEFIQYEIEPALVEAELPISMAPTIARFMDVWGWDAPTTIRIIKPALETYGDPHFFDSLKIVLGDKREEGDDAES